jgi:hypothetical protein
LTRGVRLLRAPAAVIQDMVLGVRRAAPFSHAMHESLTFCGRTFRADELELMRQMSREYSASGVTKIARTVCALLDWTRPNGGLKNHECRQLLEWLQGDGFWQLPELRQRGGRGPRRTDGSRSQGEPPPVKGAAREYEPLELALVEGPAESRRWREHLQRHHYLGGRVPFGAHLRYWVRIATGSWLVGFGPRPPGRCRRGNVWIGGSDQQRRHLQSIVNNGRFLMLSWVQSKGWPAKSCHGAPGKCRAIGRSATGVVPCCWKRSRSDSFSRDILSGCQLDLYRANRRTRSYGP